MTIDVLHNNYVTRTKTKLDDPGRERLRMRGATRSACRPVRLPRKMRTQRQGADRPHEQQHEHASGSEAAAARVRAEGAEAAAAAEAASGKAAAAHAQRACARAGQHRQHRAAASTHTRTTSTTSTTRASTVTPRARARTWDQQTTSSADGRVALLHASLWRACCPRHASLCDVTSCLPHEDRFKAGWRTAHLACDMALRDGGVPRTAARAHLLHAAQARTFQQKCHRRF